MLTARGCEMNMFSEVYTVSVEPFLLVCVMQNRGVANEREAECGYAIL